MREGREATFKERLGEKLMVVYHEHPELLHISTIQSQAVPRIAQML